MTNPHNFNSDWDYYDSFYQPYELKAYEILENDPFGYLTQEQTVYLVNRHWDEIADFMIDKGYVEEYILELCKEEYYMNQEV